jgi:hypothetical protein
MVVLGFLLASRRLFGGLSPYFSGGLDFFGSYFSSNLRCICAVSCGLFVVVLPLCIPLPSVCPVVLIAVREL